MMTIERRPYAKGEIQYAQIHQGGIAVRTMANPEVTISTSSTTPPARRKRH